MKWLLAYVLLNHWFVFSQTERILVLAPVCSKSHKISFMPIVEALAEKGHQVTVVTPFSPENQKPNVKEIVLKKNALMEIDTDWFEIQKQNILKVFTWTITVFRTTMKDGYDILMSNEEFQEVLRSRDVDLVIVDAILNDFVLPIIDHINVPFIFYCPASGVPWVMDMLNVPQEYASVPVGMGDYGSQMTFMQRMENFLSTELFFLVRKAFWLNMLKDVTNKDFPNSRSISEIERDSQLCIINSHPATAWARPLPQNVIPIPALHTRPPKPLPQVLTESNNQLPNHSLILNNFEKRHYELWLMRRTRDSSSSHWDLPFQYLRCRRRWSKYLSKFSVGFHSKSFGNGKGPVF